MTSILDQYPEPPQGPLPMRLAHGITHSVRARAQERWGHSQSTAERKRTEMLTNFEKFCREHGLDIATGEPAQEPKLAHAVHDFVFNVVSHRAQQIDALRAKATVEGSTPVPDKLLLVPYDPVRNRIDEHYARFGTNRRHKSADVRKTEDENLAQHKRPIFAKIYLSKEEQTASNQEGGEKITSIARFAQYPEIAIAMELRDVCNDQGYDFATDGAEVVLAAYGKRFLDLAHYSDMVVSDEYGTRRIHRDFDIPEEFAPENYHSRD